MKVPLLLMLMEIFGRLTWLKYLALCWVSVIGAFNAATMIYLIVQCVPRTGFGQLDYLSAIAAPACSIGSKPVNLVGGIVNVCSDLFILLLPMLAIWSLQLPVRKKIGITTIFLTGFMRVTPPPFDFERLILTYLDRACISSCLGLAYRLRLNETSDNTWNSLPLYIVKYVLSLQLTGD